MLYEIRRGKLQCKSLDGQLVDTWLCAAKSPVYFVLYALAERAKENLEKETEDRRDSGAEG